jgi:excisionase family DNA binding protein
MTTQNSKRHFDKPAAVADRVAQVAERLRALEHEAAALAAELLELEPIVRDTVAAPTVPVLAYTIEQVGQAIGLGRSTVAAMVSSGELPSITRGDGTARRVLVSDLNAYLESLRDRA